MARWNPIPVIAFLLQTTHGGWIPEPGPGDGSVNCLAASGTEICAGTNRGIFCTPIEREAWHPAYLPDQIIWSLAKTRSGWAAVAQAWDSMYTTVPHQFHISLDGGLHWSTREMADTGYGILQAAGDL